VSSPPSGVLLVDKPEGPTSHDIVQVVRRRLRTREVGHTGTLDPMATGLLVLCIGSATRLVPYLTEQGKAYSGVLRLGVTTTTEDRCGEVVLVRDGTTVSDSMLDEAIAGLIGPQQQRPPAYSAIKVGGVRSHALARAGVEVEHALREVEIVSFDRTSRDGPLVGFTVRVSKGTYVRSLARDLGERLGCGAHLTALRRLSVGAFDVEGAPQPDEVVRPEVEGARGWLTPAQALEGWPTYLVTGDELRRILQGQSLEAGFEFDEERPVRVLDDAGVLRAVATWHPGSRRLRPNRVFATG
jgi:tRNA pseudouridine55 synthase